MQHTHCATSITFKSVCRRMPPPATCGYSLLEVLVALAVLSVGVLGLAALQTTGLKLDHQSYLRTQATLQAYDMMDRIRANPTEIEAGGFDNVGLGYIPGGTSDCTTSCTPAQLRDHDIEQWAEANADLLPEGQGAICRGVLDDDLNCAGNPGQRLFQVGIEWREDELIKNAIVEAEL